MAAEPPDASAASLCQAAILDAERSLKLPKGLLPAIARVESGRPDPRTGRVLPWPWTIDVEGNGLVLRDEGRSDRRRAGGAGARHTLDRRRLPAGQPHASSGRLRDPRCGVRSRGERGLWRALPGSAVRAIGELAGGRLVLPFADARSRRGLSPPGDGGVGTSRGFRRPPSLRRFCDRPPTGTSPRSRRRPTPPSRRATGCMGRSRGRQRRSTPLSRRAAA